MTSVGMGICAPPATVQGHPHGHNRPYCYPAEHPRLGKPLPCCDLSEQTGLVTYSVEWYRLLVNLRAPRCLDVFFPFILPFFPQFVTSPFDLFAPSLFGSLTLPAVLKPNTSLPTNFG